MHEIQTSVLDFCQPVMTLAALTTQDLLKIVSLHDKKAKKESVIATNEKYIAAVLSIFKCKI